MAKYVLVSALASALASRALAASIGITVDVIDTNNAGASVLNSAKVVPASYTHLAVKVTRASGAWPTPGSVTIDGTKVALTGVHLGSTVSATTAGITFATGVCSGTPSVCTFAVTLSGSVDVDTFTTVAFASAAVGDGTDTSTSASVSNLIIGVTPVYDVAAAHTSGAASVLAAAGAYAGLASTSTGVYFLKVTLSAAGSGGSAAFVSGTPTLDPTKVTISGASAGATTLAAAGITLASSSTSQPVATETYFALTTAATPPDTYTITLGDGALTDAAGRVSASAATVYTVKVGFAPTVVVSSDGSTDSTGTVFAPGTTVYVRAALDYGTWSATPALDATKITITTSTGATVTPASVGITIAGGTGTTSGAYAYWPVTLAAGALADRYQFALAPSAITDTQSGSGFRSSSATLALASGLRVGFGVTGVVVRRTGASPTTWSAPLTATAIDPYDQDIYVKLTVAGGLSSFSPACPTVTSADFTFTQSTTQTVTLGAVPNVCSPGDPSVYVSIRFSTVNNAGVWSLNLAAKALSLASGSATIDSYAITNAISAASTSLVLGYAFALSVVNAGGASVSANHITPGVAGAYFLRVTLDGANAPGGAFSPDPVVVPSAVTVKSVATGQATSAITVGAFAHAHMGTDYVDLPLTIAASAAAGQYTFSVSAPGLLTYAGLATGPVTTGVNGNNPGIITQTVGIGFTVDLVTVGGASYGGKPIDPSGGADVTAYLRITRTTGVVDATPSYSGSLTGAALSVLPVSLNGVADGTHNYYFTFAADTFSLTGTSFDVKVVVPVASNPAAAGVYAISFAEGAFVLDGVNSAATTAAATIVVPYAVAAGSPALTDGSGNSVTATWFGPVSTGLFLRVGLTASGVAGAAAGFANNGGDNEVSVDTSKIVFYVASTLTPATGFAFTGAVTFSHLAAGHIEVGLDTTAVAPGSYDVWLAAGAVTDVYGVASQASAAAIATVKVGFGVRVEYWKTDGVSTPTTAVAPGEWLSPTGLYFVRVTPDAAARDANVKLSNDFQTGGIVPTTLSSGTWAASGALQSTGAVVATFAVGTSSDTVGRESYYYVVSGASVALTPGTYAAAAIAGGTLRDATKAVFNYAYTLPQLNVGWAPTPLFYIGTSGPSYAGVYNPYLATFASAPTPLNTHANLQLWLTHPTAAAVTNYNTLTTSVFASFPLASAAVTSSSATSSIVKFVLADVAADKVAPGVYDLTLANGALLAGGLGSAEVRLRVILGMPAVLYDAAGVAVATLRSTNQSTALYVTAGRSAVVRQYIGQTADIASTANFSTVYGSVLRNGDATIDVSGLVSGTGADYVPTASGIASASSQLSSVPYYADFALDITGLSDGTDYYTITRRMASATVPSTLLPDVNSVNEWAWPNLAVIVDRTPPTGTDTRYAGTAQYLAAAATITIPAMFADTVSAPTAITITSVTADDMHGFALVTGGQGAAALVATSVLGPEGDITFTVTAADEAGNTATAKLTVTLYMKRKPVLSIADSRAVFTSGTLTTGAAQIAGSPSVLTFKVIATFPEAVSGIVVGDLTVAYAAGSAPTVNTPSSSANGRVWAFVVTVPAASVTDANRYTFTLASSGGRTVAKSLLTAPSDAVFAVIDNFAPVASAVTSSYTAVVGIPFFAVIPTSMHSDLVATANPYVTIADNIDIVSGSVDVNVNLALTAGKAGAAYVSGTASSLPVNGAVTFTITARDAAGNSVSSGTFKVLVVTQITAGYPLTAGNALAPPSLTFDATTAPYTDGNSVLSPNAIVLSSSASWVSTNGLTTAAVGVDSVSVYIVTPDLGAASEAVTGAASSTHASRLQRMASVGNNGVAREVWSRAAGAAVGSVPAADVTAYLRSLTYTDANTAPTTATRVVHVVVVRDGYVVGYVSKKIAVVSVDAAPVVAAGASATFTYSEAIGAAVAAAPTVAVTDIDDTSLTKATFTIRRTGDGSTYGGCDATRDALFLRASYMAPATPRVEASWDPTSCTLTLAPASSVASLPIADFAAAMRAVSYKNLNAQDPTNALTTTVGVTRKVDITVTDAASGGRVTTPLTSAAATTTLTIVPVDNAASISLDKAYAVGGMFYETATSANWKSYTDPASGRAFRVRKFSVVVDPTVTSLTTYYVSFDLTKQADRAFGALGAITDADTLSPVDASLASTITFSASGAGTGVTVASSLAGGDGSYAYYLPAVAGGHSLSRLPITIANPSVAAAAGEVKVTMTYGAGGPTAVFFVDVRQLGCAITTSAAVSAVDLTKVYPSSAACASALASDAAVVHTVSAGVVGVSAPAAYAGLSQAAKAKAAALIAAGSSTADAIVAAAVERGAARGMFAVTVPANSWSTTTATLALSALPLDAATAAALPAVKAGEAADATVSLKLGPACQTFSTPVRVCVQVGDTAAGFTRNLRFASQADCADATKGYGPFEPAASQTFSPISGELCGYTSHFSVAGVVVTPVLGTPTIAKHANMGGSCPNDCHSHGYCRAEGKCVCFQGYTGYDCSARSCPVAQSWDSAGLVVHKQVECGNRGTCDPKLGKCTCYPGFTGSACDRALCPNSCSGHGRCLTLGELSGPQSAAYGGWEAARLQVCQCDGGYSGPDCSQRTCPFGDDPETACAAVNKQVQTLTLDFGTLPASLSGALPASLYDVDELVLTFQHADGANYTTNTIADVFDPVASGATALKHALVALPGFAVNSVTVSGAVSADFTKVSYAVTFDGGLVSPTAPRNQVAANTVPGNQALLVCPTNPDGSMGCVSAGCRPHFQQARLLDSVGTQGITLNATSILAQPTSLPSPNVLTAATASQWGVAVYVVVAQNVVGDWTYAVTSEIYGAGGGASIATTPIPPGPLRLGVPLVYGLVVDFPDTPSATTGNGAIFRWRLPTCSVSQTQAADADYENVECSNRGVCDRTKGQCKCFAGYAGYGCSQQTVIV